MLNQLWSLFTFHSHILNWLHASLHIYYIHCKAKKYYVCTKNRRRFMLMSWIAKTDGVKLAMLWWSEECVSGQNSLLSSCPPLQVGMFKIHPPVPECMSEQAKGFIMCCFEPNPDKRATASELLKNSFLKGSPRKRAKPQSDNSLKDPAGELVESHPWILVIFNTLKQRALNGW